MKTTGTFAEKYGQLMTNGYPTNPVQLQKATEYIMGVASKRFGRVVDFSTLNSPNALREMFDSLPGSTMIILAGASGVGKTTFAKKLQSLYGFERVSIDEEGENMLLNYMLSGKAVSNMDQFMDDLLINNMESIIRERSENGTKTLVLDGTYIDPTLRALTASEIGKMFSHVVCIIIVSNSLEENLERLKGRAFGTLKATRDLAIDTYRKMCAGTVPEQLPTWGVGMDISVLIHHDQLFEQFKE